jgi:hypothetical protein
MARRFLNFMNVLRRKGLVDLYQEPATEDGRCKTESNRKVVTSTTFRRKRLDNEQNIAKRHRSLPE